MSNKTRVQRSVLDYIGTLPEGPIRHQRQPDLWTVSANPQSRYQVTENVANQTEATYKFNIAGWKNTAVGRRRDFARNRQHRQISSASARKRFPADSPAPAGCPASTSSIRNSPSCRSTVRRALTGLPTKIAINTKSVYLIDTANYNDLVILNGGIRYDDYGIKVSGYGATGGNPNPALWSAQEQHMACRTSTSASR